MLKVPMSEVIDFYNKKIPTGNWFSAGTMRWWNCALSDSYQYVWGPGKTDWAYYFISAERYSERHEKGYTIRKVDSKGRIDSVTGFHAYDNLTEAKQDMFMLFD